jgi:hypothetical protein
MLQWLLCDDHGGVDFYMIDEIAEKSWDALTEAIGAVNVGFVVGLVFEAWNLNYGSENGRCWAGNCVVVSSGNMQYWITWWKAPDLAVSLIKEALGLD